MEHGRGLPWKRRVAGVGIAFVIIAMPFVLCYSGLWSVQETLAALHARSLYRASPESLLLNQQVFIWLRAHGVGASLASPLVTLVQDRVVVALYGVLTLWLWRQRQPGAWMTAWALLAAAAMLLLMGLPFPWYISWFWPLCLLRWDRLHIGLSAACFCLSLTWMSGYGLLFPF